MSKTCAALLLLAACSAPDLGPDAGGVNQGPPPPTSYDYGIACPSGIGLSGSFLIQGLVFAQTTGAAGGTIVQLGPDRARVDLYRAFPSRDGCSRLGHAQFELGAWDVPSAVYATLTMECPGGVLVLQGCAATVGFTP